VTALAMILSLGKVIVVEGNIDVNIYNSQDYLCLALIILSTILLFVTLISIISAFAKTVKEATTTIMPLMIIVILAGISGMFSGGAQTDPIYYLIPIYNSVQAMSGVFSLDYSTINVIIAGLTNLVFACAGGFILTKMFNSEKVMFSR
jgi:sodium transport system permease protein